MIAYPENLPTPQRDGYGFQAVSPMASSELQSGRTRQRRRFTSVPTVATVTWLFSASEAAFFEGWFEYILLSGSLPFNCPLRSPLGFESYTANFVDIYNGPFLVGVDYWRVEAKLRLIKRPLLDKEWVTDAPEYVLGSDTFDITMNRVWTQPTDD